MKILIAGKNNIMEWPQKVCAGFRALGQEPSLFLFNKKSLTDYILHFKGKKEFILRQAKRFEQQIEKIEPDLIVFVSFASIPLDFYKVAAKFDIPAVGWIADNFATEQERPRQEHLTALFCTDTGFLTAAEAFSCPAYYLPLCAEDKIANLKVERPTLPPFFVGVANPKRIEYLEKCQTSCLIYGKKWPKNKLKQHKVYNHTISTDKGIAMMAQSIAPINLAFSTNNMNGLNFRPFEIGALGRLIMDCGAKDFPLCYEIGKEAVSFSSPQEFADLIADIEKNPLKYEKIARAGYERTIREHTYTARLTQMLNILEKNNLL